MRARRPAALVSSVILALATAALPHRADAQESAHPALRYDLGLDLGVTGASFVLHGLSEFALKDPLAPKTCGWCEPNVVDSGVREAGRWSDPRLAHHLSTLSVALTPITTIGLNALGARQEGASWDDVGVDALVVSETVAVALVTNQLLKFIVARRRPDVHALSPDDRERLKTSDDNLSFYSGHTKLAVATATAAGTVASMRRYAIAPAVWGAGLSLGATTGYLRIAADRHYFTDVLVGAALGVAYGFLIPYVFHRPITRDRNARDGAPTTNVTSGTSLMPPPHTQVIGWGASF